MSTIRLSGPRAHLHASNCSDRDPHADGLNSLTAEDLYRLARILEKAARVATDHPDRDVVAAIETVTRRSPGGRVEVALGMLTSELPDD